MYTYSTNLFPNRTMGDIRHRPDDAYCRNQHPEMTHCESVRSVTYFKCTYNCINSKSILKCSSSNNEIEKYRYLKKYNGMQLHI